MQKILILLVISHLFLQSIIASKFEYKYRKCASQVNKCHKELNKLKQDVDNENADQKQKIEALQKEVQENQKLIEEYGAIIEKNGQTKEFQATLNKKTGDYYDYAFLQTNHKTKLRSDPVLKAMTFGFPASRTTVYATKENQQNSIQLLKLKIYQDSYDKLSICPAGCIVQAS